MDIIVGWLRSVIAYVFLCLYVGLVGPPALLLTYVTGHARHLHVLGRLGARFARQLLGIRLVVEGLEHVVGDRPTVYCMNHRSNVDVVVFEVLLPPCPRLRGLYKAELGKLPILGTVMRAAGFVPVERANRDQAIAAVDAAADRLRAGDSFVLAPEGTRSRTAEMLPFKKGGFVMAIKAQVPIVPIAITGADGVMPRGRYYATPGRVDIRIGAPVLTSGLSLEDRDNLAATVRDRIAAMLG